MSFETFRSAIWRIVRTAVGVAIAETVIIKVDWNNPEVAVRSLIVAFVSGFFVALSKVLRDNFGNEDKSRGILNKLPL